ncbi:hypothetical protein C8R44DRAFT_754528 [Mycena epipterygia]|nr:hypothetical protein C8R44DRAFT_754528 [Mycena epipterygia]
MVQELAYKGNEKRTCDTAVGIILRNPINAQGGGAGASRANWLRGTAHSSSRSALLVFVVQCALIAVLVLRSAKFRVQGNGAQGRKKTRERLKRIAPVAVFDLILAVNSSSADVRFGTAEKENGLEVRGWERDAAEPKGRMRHAAGGEGDERPQLCDMRLGMQPGSLTATNRGGADTT